jgi:heme exporter protein A
MTAMPTVQAMGIRVSVSGRAVLRGVDLEVYAGSITGVMGGNGAGKTTLLRALARLLPLESGELRLLGCRFSSRSLSTPASVRRRVGIIGHGLMLYQDLSVAENLRFFGKLYGVRELDVRIKAVVEDLGLSARRDDLVRTLSRGLAQRVAIARALVPSPEVLLADEPFTGLDADGAERLENILRRFRDDRGTVLIAEHDAARCERLSDHFVVLSDGQARFAASIPERVSEGGVGPLREFRR